MIMNHLCPETRPEWRMGANMMEIWDGGAGLMRQYPPSKEEKQIEQFKARNV